jgi:hypothetical protein
MGGSLGNGCSCRNRPKVGAKGDRQRRIPPPSPFWGMEVNRGRRHRPGRFRLSRSLRTEPGSSKLPSIHFGWTACISSYLRSYGCGRGRCAQASETEMKTWKAVAGVGAACAACCAVPLLGGVAAMTAGTTAIASVGATLWACADELAPVAAGFAALAAVGGGVLWWRRRSKSQIQPAQRCGGNCNASR